MPASGPLHVLPRKPVCSTSTGPAEPQARIGPPAGKVERATEPHVPGQAGREGVKNRGELRGTLLHYATQVAPNEHAHQNAGEAEGGAVSACPAALIANAAELPSSPGGNGPARETLGTEALSWHGAGRGKAPRGGASLGRAGRPPRAPRGPRGPGALTVRGGAVVPVPGLHDEGEGALRTQKGPSGARGPAHRHRAGAAHLPPAPRPQALGSADSRWPPLSRPQDDPPPERGCPWSPSLRGLRVLAPVASSPRLDSPTGSSQQGAQGECPGLPQALAGTQKTATTSAPLTRQQGGRRGPRCTRGDRPRGARCGLGHSLPCSRATGPLTPGRDGRATE